MKATYKVTTSNKSVVKRLTHKGVVSKELLVVLNNLTLEDLIALKLELSCQYVSGRLYGLDLWDNVPYIVREAILKFAVSVTQSKADAARFLGVTYRDVTTQMKTYNVDSFFKEE